MASLQRDPSDNIHVKFRFSGKQYKRSLKTKHQRKAEAAASHIAENIRLVNTGRMELPDDVDIPTFFDVRCQARSKVDRQENNRSG